MKKIALLLISLLLTGFISLTIVKADSETFSLTMGTVKYFSSNPRQYVEGTFFVDMSFDKWYTSSCNSGQVKVDLYQSGTSRALGSTTRNIILYSSFLHKYGYFDNTKKYYEFERMSCGWKSNTVRIGS